MAKKIRIAGLCLIVLIIVAAFSAMSVIQSSTVGDIQKTQIVKTTDNSVEISWNKVSSADGYIVFKKASNAKKFEKAAQIEDAKTTTCVVEKLTQSTPYEFYVCAYKDAKDKQVLSENYVNVSACTTPAQQTILSASSDEEGKILVEWDVNSKAVGYQVQCAKGENSTFEDAQTETIADISTVSKTFEKLTPKENYSVRVRSYVSFNDKNIYGAWSEIKTVCVAEKIEMSGDVNSKKPMIALTFDDGPGYNNASDQILDVLEKYNARATFFMVGQNAKDHPKNLKRKIDLKCEIGNHTWNHSHYGNKVTAEDIKKGSDAIYQACGQYPTVFRSTGGNTTDKIRQECKKENMPLFYWSLDTQDWKTRDEKKIYDCVMKNVSDGDIILMHEIYGSTAKAVEKLVPKLIAKGYQLVTVTELVQAKTGKNPVPGQQYVTATSINNKTS